MARVAATSTDSCLEYLTDPGRAQSGRITRGKPVSRGGGQARGQQALYACSASRTALRRCRGCARDPAALHGAAGEFVLLTEPRTESDPMALLAQLLVCFGTAIGRTAH